ncbi:MAG: ABC transporter ATP-binding protein [Planctomycetota bacterium]
MATTIVPHPTRTAVEVSELRKGFGEGRMRIDVLRGVELKARGGEILLLVGPSGCGKTTLLTLIAGLLEPDSGTVKLWGEPLELLSSEEKTAFRKENVGFVFQQFNLIPTLTIRENTAIPLLIRGMAEKQAFARAAEMLDRVGLGNRLTERPGKLSGGQQQRVAIARALVGDPKLLICDEPTASLDGETGAQVMEILRANALHPDRCTIVVTHDQRIFKFGDRIAQMRDGTVETLQDAPQTESVRGIVPGVRG